ncbi:hypothetical protein Mapa_008168 [Marchantia paleacea]|nr:hypothetical protein Mapa_008168 [Marchantia paleacea]
MFGCGGWIPSPRFAPEAMRLHDLLQSAHLIMSFDRSSAGMRLLQDYRQAFVAKQVLGFGVPAHCSSSNAIATTAILLYTIRKYMI